MSEKLLMAIPGAHQFLVHLIVAAVILLLGWFISARAGQLVRRATKASSLIDPTVVPMAATVAVWGIRILVVIVVLAQLGIQTTSVIAVLGAAGLAVGLALQGTLQNIAAGIMLLALRPLRVGETVNIVGKAEGRVDEVGLFLTRLQQYDGTYITLPNNLVWGNAIINLSRNQARRIEFTVRLMYHRDVPAAIARVENIVAQHKLVLASPAPDVSVVDYANFVAVLRVRVWVRAADYALVLKELQREVVVLEAMP